MDNPSRWQKPAHESWASWAASQPETTRAAWIASLSPDELRALEYAWWFWGRPAQHEPPGAWTTWLILAGRGWGKSRTGAQTVIDRVAAGEVARVALVARTAGDVRDVVVEGESGILACSPPWFRPHYEPSKRRLTWPNGAVATTFSADQPDALRGPQSDFAWCDELAAWPHEAAWSNLLFGLRLGANPQAIVTTTPRPTPLIRQLVAARTTHVTRGATRDNAANLAPTFLDAIVAKYRGTRLGQQELEGLVLDDHVGALWSRAVIRYKPLAGAP